MSTSYTEQREEILHSIERDEQELREAVEELKTAALSWLDVRNHIAENPLMWFGGAFAIGLWFGLRHGRSAG